MRLDLDGEKPIYLQFAEELEDGILRGIFAEETPIPSINEAAVQFKINPATANRGVNLLVDEGVIYKKRGIGMFVSTGAKEKIVTKRREAFYERFIAPLLAEAGNLGFDKNEIIAMIEANERGKSHGHD